MIEEEIEDPKRIAYIEKLTDIGIPEEVAEEAWNNKLTVNEVLCGE